MTLAKRTEPLATPVRVGVICKYLGQLSLVLGLLNLAPAAVALLTGDTVFAFHSVLAALAPLALGFPLARLPAPQLLQTNEALCIVSLAFLLAALAMIYPFMTAGLSFMDALFESVSAVTTTGLSTLTDLEEKPAGFLFSRAWMQWYGGLGIVIFSVALLLMEPGIATRRLTLTETNQGVLGSARAYARSLLKVYSLLTLSGILLFWGLGLSFFSAAAHALASISTGGFALSDDSLAGFDFPTQSAVMALAALGALPLFLYYQATYLGWREVISHLELRGFLVISLAMLLLVMLSMSAAGLLSWPEIFTYAPILVLSAQSTTGFSNFTVAELDGASKLLLIVAMSIGGCIGSTAGGIKILRLLIMLRLLQLLLIRANLAQHAVVSPRLGHDPLERQDAERALLLILLFIMGVGLSWLPFIALGHDPLNALFEIVSATATTGLSTGISRPALDPLLKGILCFDMLLGRVELFAFLVLFYPPTWLRNRSRSS